MPTDLEIIAQLEQRIGKKLERLKEIQWNSVGYQLYQQQVIGLGLFACELTDFPKEIVQLQKLQFLYLNSNQLSQLPQEIAQLQQL